MRGLTRSRSPRQRPWTAGGGVCMALTSGGGGHLRRRPAQARGIVRRAVAQVETMELLANPKARRAIEEHRAGRTRFLPMTALDTE